MERKLCLIDSKYVVDTALVRPLTAEEKARSELSGASLCAPHFAVPQVQHVPSSIDPAAPMKTQVGLIFQFNAIYLSPSSVEYLQPADVYSSIYWSNVEKAQEQHRMQAAGLSMV